MALITVKQRVQNILSNRILGHILECIISQLMSEPNSKVCRRYCPLQQDGTCVGYRFHGKVI